MNGENHLKIGLVTGATYCLATGQAKMLPLALPVAGVAALLVDIDSKKSKANKLLKIVAPVSALIAGAAYTMNNEILNTVRTSLEHPTTSVMGFILFLITLAIGKMSDHRKFTHRFYGTAMFIASAYMMSPMIFMPFALGYMSHIIADSMTTAKVEFFAPFFPVKLGISIATTETKQNIVTNTYMIFCAIFVFSQLMDLGRLIAFK